MCQFRVWITIVLSLLAITADVECQTQCVTVLRSYRLYHYYTVPNGCSIQGYLAILGYKTTRAFQNAFGLKEDGIVGPNTWSAIQKQMESRGFNLSTRPPTPLKILLALDKNGRIKIKFTNLTDCTVVLSSTDNASENQFIVPFEYSVSRKMDNGMHTYSIAFLDIGFGDYTEIKARDIWEKEIELTKDEVPLDGATGIRATSVVTLNNKAVYIVKSNTLVIPFAVESVKGVVPK